MTSSRSSQGQSGGGDSLAHVVQGGPGIVRCHPADVRGSAQREARRRIQLARRGLGLSQAAFADRIGCSVDSVERWESGKAAVPGWAVVVADELTRGTGT